jgi:predicted metal-dependent hydrolase
MHPFDTIKRSNRKTLGIKVTKDGCVVMLAPWHCSESRIIAFAEDKKQWIERAKLRLETAKQQFPEPRFTEGEYFPFLGERYQIIFRDNIAGLLLFDAAFIMPPGQTAMTRHRIKSWLIIQAKSLIPARTAALAASLNLSCRSIKVSNAKRRWGSCAASGNLNFSWRLVMCPAAVIDYVILHELSHFAEMNHSPRFWQRVESICPDYRIHERWLKQNHLALNIL